MTRREIESRYTVRNGVIRSPGKFEGEPAWAVHFYEEWNNGGADEELGRVGYFAVQRKDIAEFPELDGVYGVRLEESDQYGRA